MRKKGFVTSALLYGILSLYIVLVVGTVSIIGNRKLANDKIKQSALDDVQYLETDLGCFEIENKGNNENIIKNYRTKAEDGCTTLQKNVFIPERDKYGNEITAIGANAFKNKALESVTIKSNIKEIDCNAFAGTSDVLFIIKGNMPAGSDTCTSGTRWGALNSSVRQD